MPTILGSDVSKWDRVLFSLPARWGGLGIRNPTITGDEEFGISRSATDEIIEAVKYDKTFEIEAHNSRLKETKKEAHKNREQGYNDSFEIVIKEFGVQHQRAIKRAKGEKISGWLTAIPSKKNQFDLSAQEFRDTLAIRYRHPLLNIP